MRVEYTVNLVKSVNNKLQDTHLFFGFHNLNAGPFVTGEFHLDEGFTFWYGVCDGGGHFYAK